MAPWRVDNGAPYTEDAMDDGTSSGTTVRRSQAVGKLAAALAAAQAEVRNPPKDSVNPHFKSRYADLATVRDAVLPVFTKHKLSVLQLPCELGDAPGLTTVLLHESGEWVETSVRLRPVKADPQGVGSALTYMRRYALQALAAVAADDDDDGHAATARPPARPAPDPPPEPARPEVPFSLADLRAKWLGAKPKNGTQLGACVVWMNFRLADAAAGYTPGMLEEAIRTRVGAGDEWTWAGLDPAGVAAAKAAGAEFLDTLTPKG